MTVDEIFEEWNVDSKIEQFDLGGSALNIPKLHAKYLRLLAVENASLRKLESRYKKLIQLKTEYFGGYLNGTDELKKLEWPPYTRTILKPDMQRIVEADSQVIQLTEAIGEAKEKTSILSSIIKEVSAMSFNVRAAIEWTKFTAGA